MKPSHYEETIFEQSLSKVGINLKKLLVEMGIPFTTIFVDSFEDPKLLVKGEVFPYKGEKAILGFIQSKLKSTA